MCIAQPGDRKGKVFQSTDKVLSQWNASIQRSLWTTDHIWPQIRFDLEYNWGPARKLIWEGPPQSSESAAGDSLLGVGHHLRNLPQGLSVVVLFMSDHTSWISLSALVFLVSDCVSGAALEGSHFVSECSLWIIIPVLTCSNKIPTSILNLWFAKYYQSVRINPISNWFSTEYFLVRTEFKLLTCLV